MDCLNLNRTSVPSCKVNDAFCDLFNAENCENVSYAFEDEWTTETVVTKFDLVCDQESRRDNMQTASLLGLMIGSFVFGNLAGPVSSYRLYHVAHRHPRTARTEDQPVRISTRFSKFSLSWSGPVVVRAGPGFPKVY